MVEYVLMSILLSAICGILGGLSGQGYPKFLRRWVIPIITTLFCAYILNNIYLVCLIWRVLPLSLGYGIPSPQDRKPSVLGVFWFKVFRGNHRKADLATRATIGILEAIVMLTVPILTGSWLVYCLLAPLVIFTWIYLGVVKQDEGEFPLLGEQMLWEEVQIHGINTFIYCWLALLSM